MQQNSKPAYLIIRQGTRWTDVFRMDPQRPLVAGRASSNEIPIPDERSSRRHAEFFFDGDWFVRDLGSRNGTWVDGIRIESPHLLSPGQVISIASCRMTFSDTLTSIAPLTTYSPPHNGSQTQEELNRDEVDQTLVGGAVTFRRSKSEILDPAPLELLPTATRSSGGEEIMNGIPTYSLPSADSKFQSVSVREGNDDRGTTGKPFPAQALLQLAFELAKESDIAKGCERALARLANSTNGSAFGVLVFEPDTYARQSGKNGREISRERTSGEEASSNRPQPQVDPQAQLRDRDEVGWRIFAALQKSNRPYHAPPPALVQRIRQEQEAILLHGHLKTQENRSAIDISVQSPIPNSISSPELIDSIRTAILAPIRTEGQLDGVNQCLGVIHLYSRFDEQDLSPHDLEVALALADVLGTFFANVEQRKELETKLHRTSTRVSELEVRLGQAEQWVGSSPSLKRVQEQVARIARTKATVLLRGESGVGKEIVARKIHETSPCADGPFVALNCAALSPTLLESELFGHEKGAFTGATERKLGKFEQAHRGSLMLDELGEMSLETQSKFLRVLEGSSFERVGGSKPIQVDVRVIAATNKDLEAAVAAGEFRSDLYFRLRIIELRIPPLRERPEDIQLIAEHYLNLFRRSSGVGPFAFSPRAIQAMQSYPWPGNVRELKNAVERAHVLGSGQFAEPEDLALSNLRIPGTESCNAGVSHLNQAFEYVERSLEDVEMAHIEATLAFTGGQKNRAAAILGIERSTLDRKLKRMKSDS